MKSIMIKNIPEDVHQKLKIKAAKEGKLLYEIVMEALKKYVGVK